MVRVCAVIKCYESSEYKIPNISFHAFPNDVERKQQWLEAINRPSFIPNKNSYICSKHFEQNCLVGNRLQKDACPSILEVPDIVLMKDILRQKLTTKAKQIEETQEVIASCSTTNVSGTKSVTPVRGVQIYSDTDHSSPLVSAKHLSKKFKANVGRSSTSSSVSSISGVIPIFQGIGTILQKKNKKSSTSTLTASETRNEIRKQVVMKKKENKRYINPKYVGDCLMDDMITPRISKRNWQIAKQQIIAQKRKIAYLLHRVKNINDLLKELKNKFNGRIQRISMVTEQMTEWLLYLTQQHNKMLRCPKNQKYMPELRSFALTLHFYSAKAYNFVKNKFNKSLPHPNTLSKWFQSINGEPGFTNEALEAIKIKVIEAKEKDTEIYCNLVFDEIFIRKQEVWTNKGFKGQVWTVEICSFKLLSFQ